MSIDPAKNANNDPIVNKYSCICNSLKNKDTTKNNHKPTISSIIPDSSITIQTLLFIFFSSNKIWAVVHSADIERQIPTKMETDNGNPNIKNTKDNKTHVNSNHNKLTQNDVFSSFFILFIELPSHATNINDIKPIFDKIFTIFDVFHWKNIFLKNGIENSKPKIIRETVDDMPIFLNNFVIKNQTNIIHNIETTVIIF